MNLDPEKFTDLAMKWIIRVTMVSCILVWSVHLVYSFFVYLWR